MPGGTGAGRKHGRSGAGLGDDRRPAIALLPLRRDDAQARVHEPESGPEGGFGPHRQTGFSTHKEVTQPQSE